MMNLWYPSPFDSLALLGSRKPCENLAFGACCLPFSAMRPVALSSTRRPWRSAKVDNYVRNAFGFACSCCRTLYPILARQELTKHDPKAEAACRESGVWASCEASMCEKKPAHWPCMQNPIALNSLLLVDDFSTKNTLPDVLDVKVPADLRPWWSHQGLEKAGEGKGVIAKLSAKLWIGVNQLSISKHVNGLLFVEPFNWHHGILFDRRCEHIWGDVALSGEFAFIVNFHSLFSITSCAG